MVVGVLKGDCSSVLAGEIFKSRVCVHNQTRDVL